MDPRQTAEATPIEPTRIFIVSPYNLTSKLFHLELPLTCCRPVYAARLARDDAMVGHQTAPTVLRAAFNAFTQQSGKLDDQRKSEQCLHLDSSN
jgi:hypothetical protein